MSKAITLLAALVILLPVSAMSQGIERFSPRECQFAAQDAATLMSPGAILVAIINGTYKLEIFGTSYNTGMDLDSGYAIAWIYAFYQPNGDSVFFKPFAKTALLGPASCNDASAFLPNASVPAANIGREVVPAEYLSGPFLIQALNNDGDYTAYHAAHPDSLASAVVLTVSREAVLDYPAGTPFWFLTWTPSDGNPGLTCFVHAINSETVCFSGPVSVADDAVAAGFNLAPNPAFDAATLTLPMSWMGTTATIEAVDATGSVVELSSNVRLLSPAVSVPLTSLQSGMYTLRIRNDRQVSVIPMSVVR